MKLARLGKSYRGTVTVTVESVIVLVPVMVVVVTEEVLQNLSTEHEADWFSGRVHTLLQLPWSWRSLLEWTGKKNRMELQN